MILASGGNDFKFKVTLYILKMCWSFPTRGASAWQYSSVGLSSAPQGIFQAFSPDSQHHSILPYSWVP